MLTWVLIVASALSLNTAETEAFRLTARAFEKEVQLEVHGPQREEAKVALSAALAEMHAMERLTDPDGTEPGGLGQLNRGAGGGPVQIDSRLAEILRRAEEFCSWSEGAFGPLGGQLNALWHHAGSAVTHPAQSTRLPMAVASSRCDLLSVDPEKPTAELAAGVRADLFGFASGFAVDRAVTILNQHRITNGSVSLGGVSRCFGPGPDGRGWLITLPARVQLGKSPTSLWLLDRSIAIASVDDLGLFTSAADGGQPIAPYIHHRKGIPAEGVLAVLVSTELALDSQGLASSLFVTGSHDGQMHLGSLKPSPAVRWLLGRGLGKPLVVDYHWTEISRGNR